MKTLYLLLFIFTFTLCAAQQQNEGAELIQLNPADTSKIEYFDQKTFELYYKPSWFYEDSLVKAKIYMPKHEIPKLSDEEIMDKMDRRPTLAPCTLNHVFKQQIIQFSTNRRQPKARMLVLC